MLKVMEGLPAGIFGVESDAVFEKEDQDQFQNEFDRENDKKPIRRLLLCFSERAEQSESGFNDRYANWTMLRNVEVVALVGPSKWHDRFEMLAAAIRADHKIFEIDQREDAINWLMPDTISSPTDQSPTE